MQIVRNNTLKWSHFDSQHNRKTTRTSKQQENSTIQTKHEIYMKKLDKHENITKQQGDTNNGIN